MLLVLLTLVLSLLGHVTVDGIRKLIKCGVSAMLGDQGMQVTGVAWWALLWESQLLNHNVSASPPGLQHWGDLLCTREGAGKSLCRSYV